MIYNSDILISISTNYLKQSYLTVFQQVIRSLCWPTAYLQRWPWQLWIHSLRIQTRTNSKVLEFLEITPPLYQNSHHGRLLPSVSAFKISLAEYFCSNSIVAALRNSKNRIQSLYLAEKLSFVQWIKRKKINVWRFWNVLFQGSVWVVRVRYIYVCLFKYALMCIDTRVLG